MIYLRIRISDNIGCQSIPETGVHRNLKSGTRIILIPPEHYSMSDIIRFFFPFYGILAMVVVMLVMMGFCLFMMLVARWMMCGNCNAIGSKCCRWMRERDP